MKYQNVVLLLSIFILTGCEKFLSEKPDQKLVIPKTLDDYQSILEISRVTEYDPISWERCTDNYFITDASWLSLTSEYDRRAYTWSKELLFERGNNNEWGYLYDNIYRANIVIHGLDNYKEDRTVSQYAQLKGDAYFVRGRSFFNGLQIWAKAYDATTAATDLGIPLRLDADINKPTVRASVKEGYERVLSDLKTAAEHLVTHPLHVVRPSLPAAYALIARTYLAMRMYDSVYRYTNLGLQYKAELLDFNSITNPNATYPVAPFNVEVVYHSFMTSAVILGASRARIDTTLYKLYDENDWRKVVYCRPQGDGYFSFRGNYTGHAGAFSGIATSELYLMRAEANARIGNVTAAMDDINKLMAKRWKTGTWINKTAATKEEALAVVLTERRKELIMRGLRWMDIKRLNKEGYNISLKRIIQGVEHVLPPNDSRYALPIPEDVIEMTGIQQN